MVSYIFYDFLSNHVGFHLRVQACYNGVKTFLKDYFCFNYMYTNYQNFCTEEKLIFIGFQTKITEFSVKFSWNSDWNLSCDLVISWTLSTTNLHEKKAQKISRDLEILSLKISYNQNFLSLLQKWLQPIVHVRTHFWREE
jgi:hypothetical protein